MADAAHITEDANNKPGYNRRTLLGVCLQGQGDVLNRGARAGRTLRVQKVVKPCPTCKADIADFLANCQVNRYQTALASSLAPASRPQPNLLCCMFLQASSGVLLHWLSCSNTGLTRL